MNFFQNKKIFLTGHTGFKGTWLSKMLEMLGADVYGYSLKPETSFYEEASPKVVRHYEGDIRDEARLEEALQESAPEIIIHLASHSTLNRSYEITDYIFETNVMGVVNLLECVRKVSSVKAVLIVTSDKCYRNLETDQLYVETSILGAQDPYSTSKACQELITESYRNSFFCNEERPVFIATARASNVIGGGDYHYDRLLPGLVRNFMLGREAVIRKPDAIRPWQNVLDVLAGYLILVQKMLEDGKSDGIFCEPYNFGPEQEAIITVAELTRMIAGHFDKPQYRIENKMSVKETKTLKISSEKAKKMLHWYPLYSIEETVRMAVEFEKRKMSGEMTRDICEEYIREYLGRKKHEL